MKADSLMMMKKTFMLTAIMAVGLFSALSSGCGRSNANDASDENFQARPVKIMVVADVDSREMRSFPGIVKADREIDLAFRVGGPVIEYDLNIGQRVKEGETLARIDPRDFDIRVQKLSAELKAAEIRMADAERDFERQKNLLKESAASQAQYDKTQMLVETTRAGIESLRADLAAAKNALADTRLKAPFDGVINRKLTENHETVAPGVPVVSLLDVSQMEVATVVPEDIVIHEADIAEIFATLDAHPGQKLDAFIREVGRQTDSANQSYPMTIILETPQNLTIAPGMAATVHLILNNATEAKGVYLPTAAVFADANGESCVWRVNPKTLDTEKLKIETGTMRGDDIQVISGIRPGDHVVAAGARFLVEGQRIRILNGNGGEAS